MLLHGPALASPDTGGAPVSSGVPYLVADMGAGKGGLRLSDNVPLHEEPQICLYAGNYYGDFQMAYVGLPDTKHW